MCLDLIGNLEIAGFQYYRSSNVVHNPYRNDSSRLDNALKLLYIEIGHADGPDLPMSTDEKQKWDRNTAVGRTLDFGSAMTAFQVSTMVVSRSSSTKFGSSGLGGSNPLTLSEGAKATGQWITVMMSINLRSETGWSHTHDTNPSNPSQVPSV